MLAGSSAPEWQLISPLKVKDIMLLPLCKQSNVTVVYPIPCSCDQVYIGDLGWRLEPRLREHQDACSEKMMEKSALVVKTPPADSQEETTVLDHGRERELLVKEALNAYHWRSASSKMEDWKSLVAGLL